jgi:hypothetical protein
MVEAKANNIKSQIEKDVQSHFRFWGGVSTIITVCFNMLLLFFGLTKIEEWTQKYVNNHMNEPTLNRQANKIMRDKMERHIDVKYSESIARLNEVDKKIKESENKLNSITLAIQESEHKIKELDERELLRQWAMVTPMGDIATDILGTIVKPGGKRAERHQVIFRREGAGIGHGQYKCSEQQYINELNGLITDYPKLPYAYIALAMCLKHRGDPSWRDVAEKARSVGEKLMVIQPHVMSLDAFYGALIRDILELDVEQTGFFNVSDQGYYIPIGIPD